MSIASPIIPRRTHALTKPPLISDADTEQFHPIGSRGADNQPTGRDSMQEDMETERSGQTGQIPRGEVNDLLSSATDEGKSVKGRTRGMKNDAWKQERELDQSFKDTGLADAEHDVEISAAVGN